MFGCLFVLRFMFVWICYCYMLFTLFAGVIIIRCVCLCSIDGWFRWWVLLVYCDVMLQFRLVAIGLCGCCWLGGGLLVYG